MLRIIMIMQSDGENYELNPGIQTYFGEIGLNADQIKLVLGTAGRIVLRLKKKSQQSSKDDSNQGIENQFRRIGINTETLTRIKIAINRIGITDEQTEKVLFGVLKVIYEVRAEGESFELDPGIQIYFNKIGLTSDQIESIQGLAQRIVQSQNNSGRQRSEG